MWIGTGGNGLAKFDGKKLDRLYSIKFGTFRNHVKTLAKDRLGISGSGLGVAAW